MHLLSTHNFHANGEGIKLKFKIHLEVFHDFWHIGPVFIKET